MDCAAEVTGMARDVNPPSYVTGSEEWREKYNAIDAWISGTEVYPAAIVEG